MKIQGEHTFDAPRALVWQALLDPEVLARTLPGLGDHLRRIGAARDQTVASDGGVAETVRITVKDDSDQNASLVLDGALGHSLPPGCPVEVGRHPRPLRLVRLSGPDFVARLRVKLGLPG